ncbi:MAG: hypothetical protein ABIO91_06930 [Pyrinomonadaceae bacterium]
MAKTLIYSVYGIRTVLCSGFLLSLFLVMASNVLAQVVPRDTPILIDKDSATPTEVQRPLFQSYKGVEIGSTVADVREKLGKAKVDDKDGFYYEIGKGEFAQIRLDKSSRVRLVSVTYSGESTPPTFEEVFGKTATIEASKAGGKLYRLVRYPAAGYWVAYSRRAGENPSVTVTIQKIRSSK